MSPIVELAVANSELSTKNSWRTIAPKSAGSREPCRIWSWENIPKRSVPDLSYTNRTVSPNSDRRTVTGYYTLHRDDG